MIRRVYYDLHTHSCLSPCADDDNTPNNILGMAALAGVEIMALTDHNSSKNCPAFFKAAERYGIIPIAGMELTTSEDIHVVCLFEELEDSLAFDRFLDSHRTLINNRPEIFGKQQILDENDEEIGIIEHLLSVATDISVDDIYNIVEKHGGVCYPAHIDRDSNGIISTLGSYPLDLPFKCVEFRDSSNITQYFEQYGIKGKRAIISSDAHYLTDIKDKENFFELDIDDTSPNAIREKLFRMLRSDL